MILKSRRAELVEIRVFSDQTYRQSMMKYLLIAAHMSFAIPVDILGLQTHRGLLLVVLLTRSGKVVRSLLKYKSC